MVGIWVAGVLLVFTLVLPAAWKVDRSQEALPSQEIDQGIRAVKKDLKVVLDDQYWSGKVFRGGVLVRYKKDALWYVAPNDHIECLTLIAKRYTPSLDLAKNLPNSQ